MKNWIYIGLVCFLVAHQGLAKPPKYHQRKKEGIQQLNQLIRQNTRNIKNGLAHKNWYIFSDLDSIQQLGIKFYFKDNQLIQRLNDKIKKYNQETDNQFYIKLTGLEMIHVIDVLEKMGLPNAISGVPDENEPSKKTPKTSQSNDSLNIDSLVASLKRFRIPETETYEKVLAQYQNFYKNVNAATQQAIEQAQQFESSLTRDIYNESKLGEYGGILSITALYYYWHGEDGKKKPELRVEYYKSLALGRGFIGKVDDLRAEQKKDTTIDVYNTKAENLVEAIRVKSMMLSLTTPIQEGKIAQIDESKFMFSRNPDQALQNYADLCMNFMKEKAIDYFAKKGKGYNVVYLMNVWDPSKGGKIPLTEMIKITKQTNQILKKLRVTTRAALYDPSLVGGKSFDFNQLTDKESVVFIGGTNKKDASDLINAIKALSKGKTGKGHDDNRDFTNILDTTGFKIKDTNIETGSIYHLNKYNRGVMHYYRITQSHINSLSFVAAHLLGHNAEMDISKKFNNNKDILVDSKAWNHYGGVSTAGPVIGGALTIKAMLNPDYVKKTYYGGQFSKDDNFKYKVYFISPDIILDKGTIEKDKQINFSDLPVGKVINGNLGKYVKASKDYESLKGKTIILHGKIDNYNNSTYKILMKDFQLSNYLNPPVGYIEFLERYPSFLPNHSYRHSMEKHFGKGKAIVNPNLGKIYLD